MQGCRAFPGRIPALDGPRDTRELRADDRLRWRRQTLRSSDLRRRSERMSGVRLPFILGRFLLVSACLAFATEQSRAATLGASAPGFPLTPARFAPAPGWHLRTGTVHACPGVAASRCSQVVSVASTTRWRDCLECLPHRTLATIPAEGIAIQVTVAIERPVRMVRTFAWPPQVNGAGVHAEFEGLPRRIGVYQASTLVGTHEVSLFVWFGRSRPTVNQINRANIELRHASVT
jgi:hypothetical protein